MNNNPREYFIKLRNSLLILLLSSGFVFIGTDSELIESMSFLLIILFTTLAIWVNMDC